MTTEKGTAIRVRMRPSLLARVDAHARRMGVSRAEWLRSAAVREIDRCEREARRARAESSD